MSARVPSPVAGVDVMAMPLSTMEGFILSRVDGSSSVEDISMMSGVGLEDLLTILERLAELGAVELSWVQKQSRAAHAKRPRPESGPQPTPAAQQAQPPLPDAPAAAFGGAKPRYDKRKLDEECDLSRGDRERILDAHYAMEGLSFYELLGVHHGASKKDVRSAYFELSRFFHPDSQFGKELGSFKARMEGVFKQLTEAYEVLGKKKRRAEYDEYLNLTAQTRRVTQTLQSVEIEAEVLRQSSVPAEHTPEPAKAQARQAIRPPASPAAQVPTSLRPPASRQQRRTRAADRIRRGLVSDSMPPPARSSRPAPRPTSPPPAIGGDRSAGDRRDSVIKNLARSLHAASDLTGGGVGKLGEHLDAAVAAEERGDVLTAASELQLALALDPEREDVHNEYTRVSKLVNRSLAANYEKQAHYEEKAGKWDAAARSWGRVCDGRPEDPVAASHAAEALVKAGGDLHKAQKYAQTAVDLVPGSLENLTLLARVYLAAGLKLNARRELEKAVKLDPKDEMVKNLLREAR